MCFNSSILFINNIIVRVTINIIMCLPTLLYIFFILDVCLLLYYYCIIINITAHLLILYVVTLQNIIYQYTVAKYYIYIDY